MDTCKLKIKIGQHEFEAEGPTDVVQDQFAVFKELAAETPIQGPPGARTSDEPPKPIRPNPDEIDEQLREIMKVDDRVVSLLIKPKEVGQALLLLLYGQKVLLKNDSVAGAQILDGVKATGGLAVTRVDKLLEKSGAAGDVIVMGERRAKRYRLTNAGLAKARRAADELVSLIA